jgi:hypothetical protein
MESVAVSCEREEDAGARREKKREGRREALALGC